MNSDEVVLTPAETTARRRKEIRLAQAAYDLATMGRNADHWSDYKALVEDVSIGHEIELDDAYRLVEEGPVVY